VNGVDDKGFLFLDLGGQQIAGQHRRDGEGGDQRTGQRIAIGAGHGAEDLAFHALHGKQGVKAAIVMQVENSTELSTWVALR
jgi:hypothetical protein